MRTIVLTTACTLLVATGLLFSKSVIGTTPEPTDGHIVSGTVTDAGFNTPIPFAEVTLSGPATELKVMTDSTGAFIFNHIPTGTYTLQCTQKGYLIQQLPIQVNDADMTALHLAMETQMEIEKDLIDEDAKADESVEQPVDMLYAAPDKKVKSSASGVAYSEMAIIKNEEEYADETGYFNTESYNTINENGFKVVIGNPLSTFSIDVDNASYANVRRFINYGQTPPKDAVRIEEMVNYFDYTYAAPKNGEPFAINYEMSECPWNTNTRLVLVGLQGKDVDRSNMQPSNLVFLIDVSGSMGEPNKLPLVQRTLKSLVDNLSEKDRVALVVYAGAAGEVLPSTSCANKSTIKDAIDKLQSGGSTAGGAGIQLAYDIAVKNLIKEGNNRVILCTDGDFNVGSSSDAEMTRLIEEKRKSGVFITVCGFGMGNYKDSKMESIADNGNGSYYYIDNDKEAKKVFTTDMRGTLFTIAKDVKIQIEFNPALVESYRLIGYENRLLNKEDFDDDAKDAGELGAGHRVTALYEIKLRTTAYKPEGMNTHTPGENLKYQTTQVKSTAYNTDEIMTLKLRYKDPNGETSKLTEKSLSKNILPLAATTDNFRMAAAVAEFGMLLRDSEFKGDATYEEVIKLANSAKGMDVNGYRGEFIDMVKTFTAFSSLK